MKIYKLIADSPDGKFYCYIGSTSKELNERLLEHKRSLRNYLKNMCRYVTSFKIIQKSWFEISLIEDLGDCSKNELLNKEDYYINYYKSLTDDYIVVNKYKPNGINFDSKRRYDRERNKTDKRKNYFRERKNTDKYKEYQKYYNEFCRKK
jgi:hypothetical protein